MPTRPKEIGILVPRTKAEKSAARRNDHRHQELREIDPQDLLGFDPFAEEAEHVPQ